MRQRARKRGRECGARARKKGAAVFSRRIQFPFFGFSLSFFLSASPPTAQNETLCCFVPCIHRAHSFSLLRARMRVRACACVCAREIACVSREQGGQRERERERNPAATRGPSRWRRINRCALHLAPPRSPATPLLAHFGLPPFSATDSDLRTRARISPCTSRTAYDLRGTQAIYIRERYSSAEESKIDRRNERKLSRGRDAFFIPVIRLT